MIILRFTPIALLIFFLQSCAKDEGPFVRVTPSANNDTTDIPQIPEPTVFPYTISFTNHVRPLFPASCVQGCHNPSRAKLDLRPSVAYDQLLTDGFSAPYVDTLMPKISVLYKHLTGEYTLMPMGGPKLSQGMIDTVYNWIVQGALNN